MNKLILIFSLFVTSLFAQSQVTVYGDLQPGGLVFCKAPGVKEAFINGKQALVDSEGFFILGFDRDEKGSQALKLVYRDGSIDVKKFALKDRSYKIQRINKMEEKYVSPPKEVLERIKEERAQIKEARKMIDSSKAFYSYSGFIKPVDNYPLSSVFGSQRVLNGVEKDPHAGVDYAAPKGTKIKATADGVVCFTGNDFFYNGNFVLLDHGFGLNSVYIHMDTVYVKQGQKVSRGDVLGEVGTTGRSTGPHLHWGVSWYRERIDPLSLLKIDLDKPQFIK